MVQNNTCLLSYTSGGQTFETGFPNLVPKCWQACNSWKALRKNPFSCHFQLLKLQSLLMVPFQDIFKANSIVSSNLCPFTSAIIFLSSLLWSNFPVSLLKGHMITFRPHWDNAGYCPHLPYQVICTGSRNQNPDVFELLFNLPQFQNEIIYPRGEKKKILVLKLSRTLLSLHMKKTW